MDRFCNSLRHNMIKPANSPPKRTTKIDVPKILYNVAIFPSSPGSAFFFLAGFLWAKYIPLMSRFYGEPVDIPLAKGRVFVAVEVIGNLVPPKGHI
jgi:hypothetical protein